MRDVTLYPYDDVAASVTTLVGDVLPERSTEPIVMDDVTSYRIDAKYAEMRLSADDMARLMNRHVLPNAKTPIRHVDVAFENGAVALSGHMVKLGVAIPFTATAELAPTVSGDLRVHVTAMRAAGIVPKGLTDALGLELSVIAQPENRRVFHIEGDDMIVPVLSMFPPPRVSGRLTSVRVTPSGLTAVVGKPAPLPSPPVQATSYMYFRGGTLNFAKLTMHGTDLVVLPADDARPLAYSPMHYYAQLQAGCTASLPNFALAAYVKDYRTFVPASRQTP
jgi:hypothetical protein